VRATEVRSRAACGRGRIDDLLITASWCSRAGFVLRLPLMAEAVHQLHHVVVVEADVGSAAADAPSCSSTPAATCRPTVSRTPVDEARVDDMAEVPARAAPASSPRGSTVGAEQLEIEAVSRREPEAGSADTTEVAFPARHAMRLERQSAAISANVYM